MKFMLQLKDLKKGDVIKVISINNEKKKNTIGKLFKYVEDNCFYYVNSNDAQRPPECIYNLVNAIANEMNVPLRAGIDFFETDRVVFEKLKRTVHGPTKPINLNTQCAGPSKPINMNTEKI